MSGPTFGLRSSYNELHNRNYPSIGCTHCTSPVMPGEDSRAGGGKIFQKQSVGYTRPRDVDAGIYRKDWQGPKDCQGSHLGRSEAGDERCSLKGRPRRHRWAPSHGYADQDGVCHRAGFDDRNGAFLCGACANPTRTRRCGSAELRRETGTFHALPPLPLSLRRQVRRS
jgi:3''-phosphoadenosine 5''-phosphosulfate sulfotransferase (PAPS reductase)/FAD synthetase and related enzymes